MRIKIKIISGGKTVIEILFVYSVLSKLCIVSHRCSVRSELACLILVYLSNLSFYSSEKIHVHVYKL